MKVWMRFSVGIWAFKIQIKNGANQFMQSFVMIIMHKTPLSSFPQTYEHSGSVLSLSVLSLSFGKDVLKHSETQSKIIFLFD